LRILAANRKTPLVDLLLSDMYVQLPLLPRDLIIALLLAAVGFPLSASKAAAKRRLRHSLFAGLALVGGLIAILCYWIERMLIVSLVYIAIQAIQNWQPPKLLPPEMNVSGDVYLHRFALASFAGGGSVILNLILMSVLVACWNRRRLRYLLGAALLI